MTSNFIELIRRFRNERIVAKDGVAKDRLGRSSGVGVWLLVGWIAAITIMFHPGMASGEDSLDSDWKQPPNQAKLRNYWWWLNGNVTKEAITRDLEEMAEKGFGGALICDADGSFQDGNDKAPHGITFMSPEWLEMFQFALSEANRLGLEMSVNIQSGWNLGGPQVTPDDAGKKYVWSELQVRGGQKFQGALEVPEHRNGYYRDTAVIAYPLSTIGGRKVSDVTVQTSSQQVANAVLPLVTDGNSDTFWVSDGREPGDGPTPDRPEWIEASFVDRVEVDQLTVEPREGYGPKACRLLVSDDGNNFSLVKAFNVAPDTAKSIRFDPIAGRVFRLVIEDAYDRKHPRHPRSVQIAELRLSGGITTWLGKPITSQTLQNWRLKTGIKSLSKSAPASGALLVQKESASGEQSTHTANVIDLTAHLDKDGVLDWEVPEGQWQVLRFGYTISNNSHVSTSSEGWKGYAIDVLDAGAFGRYWDAVVEPMITAAGPFAGTTLKYLHTDSWEIEPLNWTPTLLDEFKARRGYDPIPWLPALTGRIVNDRGSSNQFLNDFRKTIGDLVIDNHYRPFRENARKNGMAIHPESGGPHAVPIDAQRALGFSDVPMSEFWAESWRHRVGDSNRFFVKQPASAAHTYGRRLVAAEGFTTIGPHWQETLWDNLKPAFDKACCDGMNFLFWHEFVCSPVEQGIPGIQYFAGTHLNPNVTWWEKSKPFFDYINRCQSMLQQGLFVADVCYYYGDHVPNFAQLKQSDPAGVLPGFDYDVITEEALLTRVSVKDGRIVLPDGMSYRVLALPDYDAISVPVLRKIQELVHAGATVIGPQPTRSMSLSYSDAEIQKIATELWGGGLVKDNKTAREQLMSIGVMPDFEYVGEDGRSSLDYIHRRSGTTDIYFVSNRLASERQVDCTFRVTGKIPELWDPVSGRRGFAGRYSEQDGRCRLPIHLDPYGSCFVVFRDESPDTHTDDVGATPNWLTNSMIEGPWDVTFDREWGGPGTVQFEELISWPTSRDEGIKFYSGTAIYRKELTLPVDPVPLKSGTRLWLDLGSVRELAEVRINGQSCGIVWTPPFRVDITNQVRPGNNQLEVEVVNFWPNRIIGDDALPRDKRLTRTNIRKLTKDTDLMSSGLLGPITLRTSQSVSID